MAKVFRKLFPKHVTDPILQQAAMSQEIARVREEIRRDMPDNLLLKGYKVYSQTDEDGIIAAIFDRIGGGRTFIEIGSGNGTENNTHALLLKGWRGVWVDGRADRIAFVRSEVGPSQDLFAEQAFVTRENVPTLVAGWLESLGTQGDRLLLGGHRRQRPARAAGGARSLPAAGHLRRVQREVSAAARSLRRIRSRPRLER